jgi:hypothetical protein
MDACRVLSHKMILLNPLILLFMTIVTRFVLSIPHATCALCDSFAPLYKVIAQWPKTISKAGYKPLGCEQRPL